MFDPVFESLRKATETTVQMQQEMFKKFAVLWPGLPASQSVLTEPMQKFQKKWNELFEETLKKQRETLETQFKAGLQNIEEAFRLAEVKDFEELRAKTLELWQKTFEALKKTYEAQARDFQAAMGKWTELFTKGAA
jgi:hypothetical protein